MRSPITQIVVYGLLAVIVWTAVAFRIRAWWRDRQARRATPETGLRPGQSARRRGNLRARIVMAAVAVFALANAVLLQFGPPGVRDRLAVFNRLLDHVGL